MECLFSFNSFFFFGFQDAVGQDQNILFKFKPLKKKLEKAPERLQFCHFSPLSSVSHVQTPCSESFSLHSSVSSELDYDLDRVLSNPSLCSLVRKRSDVISPFSSQNDGVLAPTPPPSMPPPPPPVPTSKSTTDNLFQLENRYIGSMAMQHLVAAEADRLPPITR